MIGVEEVEGTLRVVAPPVYPSKMCKMEAITKDTGGQ